MSEELVFKSFIPGKGWVKASEAGVSELRRAQTTRPLDLVKRTRAEREHWANFKNIRTGNNQLINDMTRHRGSVGSTQVRVPKGAMAEQMRNEATGGFMIRYGGKSKGVSHVVMPRGANQHTIDHEMAHAAPRRSSYRMHQIGNDPVKSMREEARADMNVGEGGYFRTFPSKHESAYTTAAANDKDRQRYQSYVNKQPGSPGKIFDEEPVQAYRDTQDRIAGARKKAGKDPHDHTTYTRPNTPPHVKVYDHVRDYAPEYTAATVIGAAAAFRGNQYMDARRQRRRTLAKSFETLDMGGAMVSEEEPKRDLPVRDLNTGRFVGTPHLQKKSQSMDSLVWEATND